MLFPTLLTTLLVVRGVLSAALQTRQIADFCGFVEAELIIDGISYGYVEVCVCVDLLDSFIETNGVTKNAAAKTSTSQVKSALESILYTTSNAQECTYPPDSTPVCTEDNPCAWTCDFGYTQSGDSCVPAGSGAFRKRDISTCTQGLARCGVWSSWGSRSYECLDTQVELESCGGCVFPYGDEVANGQDCSQIKGVSDVQCLAGRCVVSQCRPGYIISPDFGSCIHPGSGSNRIGNTTALPGHHHIENILYRPT